MVLVTVWFGVGAYLFIKSLEAMHSPQSSLNAQEEGLYEILHHNIMLSYIILFITCALWPVILPVTKLLRQMNK